MYMYNVGCIGNQNVGCHWKQGCTCSCTCRLETRMYMCIVGYRWKQACTCTFLYISVFDKLR